MPRLRSQGNSRALRSTILRWCEWTLESSKPESKTKSIAHRSWIEAGTELGFRFVCRMFLNFCVKGINQTEMDPPSKPIQWACATVGVAEE
jgi:hypothetical protein